MEAEQNQEFSRQGLEKKDITGQGDQAKKKMEPEAMDNWKPSAAART
jgi:hypothetical protein